MFKGIDLFSDTGTLPSKAMLNAMVNAKLGDEQKGEDPTTRELEELAAAMFGFNAALFFPSATMANEIAIRLLTSPGDELIAAQNCHLFRAETGGPAILSQVMCKPIMTESGIFTAESIRKQYTVMHTSNFPITTLMSVENTTNFGGGVAWTKDELTSVVACADELGLKKHMDGSRIFNASIKTNLPVDVITQGFDTVTLCLSKGLGCPTGALLMFDQIHFPKVRRLKQLMGGSMRQSGILAAAGIYALKNNIERLAIDHENATLLASELAHLPMIRLLNNPPATNMVYFAVESEHISPSDFLKTCTDKGVRFSMLGKNQFRAVTHLDVSREDILQAINIVKDVVG